MSELIEEGFGSDGDELEILEDEWVNFHNHVDTIRAEVGHLLDSVIRELIRSLYDSGIIAWSLEDLRPAVTAIEHALEQRDEIPIHN